MSFDYRKDGRSTEVFASNIKQFTEIESIIAGVLIGHFRACGTFLEVVDTGVDNTGNLIGGFLRKNTLDFLFISGGTETATEIKNCPCPHIFCTFKRNALEQVARLQGQMILYTKTHFYTVSADGCRFLLDNYQSRTDYRGFSGHPSIRVYARNSPKAPADPTQCGPLCWEELIERGVVMQTNWHPDAQAEIDALTDVIFRPKARD
jgi:hypothetical protein